MTRVLLLSVVLLLAESLSLLAAPPVQKIDFARDIKPILSNNCYYCHGPDADQRKGGVEGLRLDTLEGATVDLGGHAAIVPGQPAKSEMLARLAASDPEERMPPKSTGKTLSPREIQLLTEWIRQGAHYAGHWSYVKPVRGEVPAVKNEAWSKNAIDRFLFARLEKEKLKPSPEADRYTLIRRLSLDLTGLPPTLKEVDEFVNDKSAEAYEHLIDRLLKKETFGEHWAHMWLDLARYADSAGYADDPPRTIWMYRDYVIRALNSNIPFDQFTIEQLAGDLLPNPTDEQFVATAFHRNTLTNNEGGTNDEEFRNVAVVDRVNTTMAVWMGTTMACAQCHTHKYDPLSQEEYFRLFAFFNSSEDADKRDEAPLYSIYQPQHKQQRGQWEEEIATLERSLKNPTPELSAARDKWEQAFPTNLAWHTPKPASVKTEGGVEAAISEDGTIRFERGEKNDIYSIELPLRAGMLRSLRLEALPADSLPGKGPGFSNGNYVVSRVRAAVLPREGEARKGRFVRIEVPGKQKMLSLAEVQVFRGNDNVAVQGEATQSTTDYEGPAKLAIDGNTDGDYFKAKSTTHTAVSDNPWWEVDLKSEQPIDRIAIWNRTDGNVGGRLTNFSVVVLDELRETIWKQDVAQAPKPSVNLSLNGQREVDFKVAVADYTQAGFDAAEVLVDTNPKKKDGKNKGWAIGGQTGLPHSLTLIANTPVEVKADAVLKVTIEHSSPQANHTLGNFRLSLTDDHRTAEWAKTPAAVLEVLRTEVERRTDAQKEQLTQHFLSVAPETQAMRDRLASVKKQLADLKPDTVPIMRELAGDKRRVTKIQHRGNFLDVGKEVEEGTPAIFPPLPEGAPRNRLALAKWLVDENNPLTARVIANRYWEQLFGIGIVSSSEEFGSQGELPFHPELLDWLATELMRLRWDIKGFIKMLVNTAAYRQTSRVTPDLQQRDPDNRLLARGPRFRLSAEMVRDQALFSAGLLSSKMYGPPVKPLQPSSGLNAAFGSGIDWQTSAGDDKFRRGLYTTWRRSNPYPSMATFDAPNREVCTVRRSRTNTPLQALVTLNDPVYVEAAQAWGRRVVTEGGASVADRARYGFRLCLSRPPHDEELARLVSLYEQTLAGLEKQPQEAARLATEPLGPIPAGMNAAELAAWTVVGNVILNLDEALMKR